MTRPYISLSIAQLEFLASEDFVDPQPIQLLIDELRHRNGPRARRLLAQLELQLSSANTEDGSSDQVSEGAWVGPAGSADCGGGSSTDAHKPLFQTAEDYELLLRRHEDLRLTFTVEAELLARWGMTPSMPLDMQELIFTEWAKRLPQAPDVLGRSVESLEADQSRIADERRLHRRAAWCHKDNATSVKNEKAK